MKGMLPFFAGAAVVALIVLRGSERRPVALAAHALGGMALAVALLVPFAAIARHESQGVTRWVMGVWEPRPVAARPASASAPAQESPEQARARGRALAERGDTPGAFTAFRRAAEAEQQAGRGP
jgi:hypothetical protein